MNLLKYFVLFLELGLFIEFLLTPEKVEITVPLKIFYAMSFLTIAGLTHFWIKKRSFVYLQ
jgi:hypothetical protein